MDEQKIIELIFAKMDTNKRMSNGGKIYDTNSPEYNEVRAAVEYVVGKCASTVIGILNIENEAKKEKMLNTYLQKVSNIFNLSLQQEKDRLDSEMEQDGNPNQFPSIELTIGAVGPDVKKEYVNACQETAQLMQKQQSQLADEKISVVSEPCATA